MIIRKAAIAAGALLLSTQASAIVVTTTGDGNTLANNILGSGVTIDSVSYIGTATSSGTFSGGLASGLGFDEGILLTSGNADIASTNTSDSFSGFNGTGGYAPLDALIPESTLDATVLEINFTTTTGDLFFNFVFASDEYNEYVDEGFNDVFAFFVDGLTAADNIALAPDGNPVSIDNVNCGNPYSGVGPNCDIFNNNDLNDSSSPFDIEYDGFTDSLTASAIGLGAGTHTIYLAIADAGDSALDSGVFIQAGSFSGEDPDPTPVPEPFTLSLLGAGLVGIGLSRRRRRG